MAHSESTANPETPPPLSDDETLARVSRTGPKQILLAETGTIRKPRPKSTLAASSSTEEVNSQWTRYTRMGIDKAAERGEDTARNRGANRQFHGWAILTRSAVTSIGYDAQASPQGGHFWHADIVLPDDAATDQEAHNHYAATWPRSRHGWRNRRNTRHRATSDRDDRRGNRRYLEMARRRQFSVKWRSWIAAATGGGSGCQMNGSSVALVLPAECPRNRSTGGALAAFSFLRQLGRRPA